MGLGVGCKYGSAPKRTVSLKFHCFLVPFVFICPYVSVFVCGGWFVHLIRPGYYNYFLETSSFQPMTGVGSGGRGETLSKNTCPVPLSSVIVSAPHQTQPLELYRGAVSHNRPGLVTGALIPATLEAIT